MLSVKGLMLKTKFEKFLTALLLLAFASQVVASAFMNTRPSYSAQQEIVMSADFMGHKHSGLATINNEAQSDCCSGDCDFGHCFTALITESFQAAYMLHPILVAFPVDSAPFPSILSFYRPPISC
jgi:hypothetical protein